MKRALFLALLLSLISNGWAQDVNCEYFKPKTVGNPGPISDETMATLFNDYRAQERLYYDCLRDQSGKMSDSRMQAITQILQSMHIKITQMESDIEKLKAQKLTPKH